MTAGLVVAAALLLGLAFTAAWLLRPDLRERIERPKHRFHDDVRRYDRGLQDTRPKTGSSPPR